MPKVTLATSAGWDAKYYTGFRRAGGALVPSLGRHVARHVKESRERGPSQRRHHGCGWWNGPSRGAKQLQDNSSDHLQDGAGRGQGRQDVAEVVERKAAEAAEAAVAAWSPRRGRNDPLLGRSDGYFQRRCGGSPMKHWCDAAARACQSWPGWDNAQWQRSRSSSRTQ